MTKATKTPAKSEALYYEIIDPDGDGDAMMIVGECDGELIFREAVGVVGTTQAQVLARELFKTRGIHNPVWIEDPEDDPRVRCLRGAQDQKERDTRDIADPKRLRARRIDGEHICVFCAHEQVCEIASATRRNAALIVIVSGCAAFDHAGG